MLSQVGENMSRILFGKFLYKRISIKVKLP